MPKPFSISDLGQNFGDCYGELFRIVSANVQSKGPALVPAAGDRSQLTCQGFFGGKDVELVLVRAKMGTDNRPAAVQETLTYRKDIAGSDLVYDLSGEFMQGKARPFHCDLRKLPARLYALLPFQIEKLSVAVSRTASRFSLSVEFQSALGDRAAGALPCFATLKGSEGNVFWQRSLASDFSGRLTYEAPMLPAAPSGDWSLTVRSLLDAKEVTLPLKVGETTGK